ncbi:hypothetical protein SAMN05443580_103377 [Variovorax sp. OV084]|jgi:hypothetical protein|nr:hypothetical protein SAMN05443580_103377 [Variovorax sp. OV084]
MTLESTIEEFKKVDARRAGTLQSGGLAWPRH